MCPDKSGKSSKSSKKSKQPSVDDDTSDDVLDEVSSEPEVVTTPATPTTSTSKASAGTGKQRSGSKQTEAKRAKSKANGRTGGGSTGQGRPHSRPRSASKDLTQKSRPKPSSSTSRIESQTSRLVDGSGSKVGAKSSHRGRVRINPLKTPSKLPNQNCPREANDEENAADDTQLILDPVAFYEDPNVKEELCAANVAQLSANPNCNPERFLEPLDPSKLPPDSFLSRRLNPRKLIDFMVRHMTAYYDIERDADPFSAAHQAMDDQLWDTVAYLIPLLCEQAVEQLKQEPLIVTAEPDALLFGDVHGNFNDVYFIYVNFIINPDYSKHRFIFLGDYVDRGPKPIEILCLLFALKLAHPKRFILLRGNHEVTKINRKYGFEAICAHIFEDTYIRRPIMGQVVYRAFNRAFAHLPMGAIIKAAPGVRHRSIFCCHGGIPSSRLKPAGARHRPWHIDELNALKEAHKPIWLSPSRRSTPGELALNELLWNDPLPRNVRRKSHFKSRHFYPNRKRGGHCSYFSEAGLLAFLSENNCGVVVRGHQYRHSKATGYDKDFDRRLITVFSSSNYCGTERNTTGYVEVTGERCHVDACTLRKTIHSQAYKDFNIFRITINAKTKEVEQIAY